MTQTLFPNGQTLDSSALTVSQINAVFQPLICNMLGIPLNDPRNNYVVRNSWQTQGAPAWGITDDIVSFQCTEEDNDYNKVRDSLLSQNDNVSLINSLEYTRVWRVFITARGPNSFDNIRLIKSAVQLDWVHDIITPFNLYLMPSVGNGIRIPELVDGQWWERVDLSLQFYEQVNESIVIPSVASVEVSTSNKNGVQSDIVITA